MTSDLGEKTGQSFGRYELLHLIARGGMGEIYLARTRGAGGFEKKVVIKRILNYLLDETEFVNKFIDEANIVTHLTHGNIVPVFDMGEEEGELFIAMEYIPGRDLRALLKRCVEVNEFVPIKAALFLVAEVCKGLAYAHRKTDPDGRHLGIVHRDISPSNVLISKEGEVKIVDFGIAKAAGRVSKTLTGRLQGKFSYMSPEQASGGSVDGSSDIFSAGVVLYELLTSERPFEGASDLESLERVKTHRPEPPSSLREEIPPAVDAIVMRALQKTTSERYQRVDEMERDILTWLFAQGGMTSSEVAVSMAHFFPEGLESPACLTGRYPRVSFDDLVDAEADRLLNGDSGEGEAFLDTATSDGVERSAGTVSVVMRQPPRAHISGHERTAPAGDGQTPSRPRRAGPSLSDEGERPSTFVEKVEGPTDVEASAPAPSGASRRRFRRGRLVGALLAAFVVALVFFLTYKVAYEPPRLTVHTTPSGADVFVDGVLRGVSGSAISGIKPGEYEVDVQLDGYSSGGPVSINLTRGEHYRLSRTLTILEESETRSFTRVLFKSIPPGAGIEVNGRMSGKTPGHVEIAVGETTRVTLVPDGSGQPYNFILEPGKTLAAYEHTFLGEGGDVALAPDAGGREDAGGAPEQSQASRVLVRFVSEPSGADVYINGVRVGQTNASFRVPAGLVKVRMSKQGFAPASQKVNTFKKQSVKLLLGESKPIDVVPEDEEGLKSVPVTIRAQGSDSRPVPSVFRVKGEPHKPRSGVLNLNLRPGRYAVSAESVAGGLRVSGSITVKKDGPNYFILKYRR